MTAGQKKTLSVNAVNGKGDTIQFTSSNKSVVKVNKASATATAKKVASTTVTALKAGTAKITAKSKYTGKSKTFTIKVAAATVTPAPEVTTNPAVVATTPAATATVTNAPNVPGGNTTPTPQTTSGAATTAPGTSANPDETKNPDATGTPEATSGAATTAPDATTTPEPTTTPEVTTAPAVKVATVSAISSVTNTRLYVTGDNLEQLDVDDVTITEKDSTTTVKATAVSVRADGTAFITTEALTEGTAYTVTVLGKDYTIVAKPADTTALKISSVDAVNNDVILVTFDNDDADELTLFDVNNYKIDGDVTVKSVEKVYVDGEVSTEQVYLKTTEQKTGTIYTLTVNNVADMAGNVIEADSTKQYAGVIKDTDAPVLDSATADKGNTITIYFTDDGLMDNDTLENVANYSISGLTVKKAVVEKNVLGDSEKIVVLTTSTQTLDTPYTLKVTGVKDVYGNVAASQSVQFTGTELDTIAPELLSVVGTTNTNVEVQFSDIMDEATATDVTNYSIPGLTITKAELNSKADDKAIRGHIVTLTTSAQTEGTTYELTVSTNVKDKAGNKITKDLAYQMKFAGIKVDVDAPTFSVVSQNKNTVVVKFSDDSVLDESTVKNPLNYYIDGLGYPTQITYDKDTKTATLKTATQTSGTVYTLTVKSVADAAGNAMTATKKQFAGLGDELVAPKIASVVSLNNQQVQVTFNKDVDNVVETQFHLVDQDGNYIAATGGSDDAFAPITKIDGKTYVLTLVATANTFDSSTNTALDSSAVFTFKNKKYTLSINSTGLTGASKITDLGKTAINGDTTSAYTKLFSGVEAKGSGPKVSSITQVGTDTIAVVFNKEIDATKAASLTASRDITVEYVNDDVSVEPTASSVTLGADKKTLYVEFSADFTPAKVVTLSFEQTAFANITDVTKALTMTYNNADEDANETNFSTSSCNTSTKLALSSVTSIDEQTIDLKFNRAIDETLISSATIDDTTVKVTLDDAPIVLGITDAELINSNTIRIYHTEKLTKGTIYTASVDLTTAGLADYNGNKNDDATAKFAANTTKNEAPVLLSAVPLGARTIQLTFSEALDPSSSIANGTDFQVYHGSSLITASGETFSRIDTEGKIWSLTLATEAVFAEGETYSVKMCDVANDASANASLAGALTIKESATITDEHGVDALKYATVKFSGADAVTPVIDETSTTAITYTQANWATAQTGKFKVYGTAAAAKAATYADVTDSTGNAFTAATNKVTFALAGPSGDENIGIGAGTGANRTSYVAIASVDVAGNQTVRVVKVTDNGTNTTSATYIK